MYAKHKEIHEASTGGGCAQHLIISPRRQRYSCCAGQCYGTHCCLVHIFI